MYHSRAQICLDKIRKNQAVQIDFVNPVVSTILAAASARDDVAKFVRFSGDAESYAEQVGLLPVMNGRYD